MHNFTLRQAVEHKSCPHLLYYFTFSSCHSSCCVPWWAVYLQSTSPASKVIRHWRSSQSARNNKVDVQYCSLCPDCSTLSSSCIFLKFLLAAVMGLMSIFVMCLMSVSQLSSHPKIYTSTYQRHIVTDKVWSFIGVKRKDKLNTSFSSLCSKINYCLWF